MNLNDQVAALEKDWAENSRWKHVKRPYSAKEVVKLRGSLQPECTLARNCLLYTSPSPRDLSTSRMPSSA